MRRFLNWALGVAFVASLTLFVAGQLGGSDERGERVPKFKQSARDVPIPIEVYEYGLNPTNTVIKAGQAVAFKNVGKQLHEIRPASEAGERAFAAAQRAGSSRPIFREPGVYPIYCEIHPRIQGRITVGKRL